MADNKCLLKNMLQYVLAVGNSEQTQFYPPNIYSNHYNTISGILRSTLVKRYPTNQSVIDMLMPFTKIKNCKITNGILSLPEDYNDLLGSPMINIKQDKSGLCGNDSDIPVTVSNFKISSLKSGCLRRPITIVPQSEFAYQTTSTYRHPTYNDPIGMFIGKDSAGLSLIQVCPFDIFSADVLYVVPENIYQLGYIMQPDATYIADDKTTIESEWQNNSFEPIFKGLCHLYAAYTRDPEIKDWSVIFSERNIL